MSSYLNTAYNADIYQSFRPTYPESFYSKILQYHRDNNKKLLSTEKLGTLLDVGCGTGVTTIPFAKNFTNAVGTDFSPNMIKAARERVTESDNVKFQVAKAEDSDSIVPAGSIDVLTAAECVHYTDKEKFIESSLTVLKSGGTLAYWIYIRPIFKNEKINQLFQDFTFKGDSLLSDFQFFLKTVNEKILNDPRFTNVQNIIFNQNYTKMSKDYDPKVLPGNTAKVYGDYEQHKNDILDIYKTFTVPMMILSMF
ncbi:unnamed protein product [Ambrosiozyma monospora]|uniref:Unnamed protein product n=1 Tax=Ambrosiozyma monospora TaxID=43982 RepID=A0ACB5TIU3_AMBMO|nr:unnamed protein product [Ambrosiozyma monospora]